MEKNKIHELEIIDMGMNFEGIAKVGGKTIFVPGAIVGERVKAKVIKDTKSYAIGKIEEIIEKSKHRVESDCEYLSRCGGCDARHMEYSFTLKVKKSIVENTLKKEGVDISKIGDIYGSGLPYNYRNKVQYPVRNINGKNVMGMFSKRSHSIITVTDCKLQDRRLNEVAKEMFNLAINSGLQGYDETNKTGDIKNIMVRVGTHTDEILCIYVVSNEKIVNSDKMKQIVDILSKDERIKGIVLNINTEDTNVILSNNNALMYGNDEIHDIIGDNTFSISTNSFFQVNTIGAELLYGILKGNMKLQKTETVLELYSGVGTIGISLAHSVKKVYGVEIIEDAVKMAEKNCKINNIQNAEYICGDAKEELEKLRNKVIYFDCLVVDPPRKGLDKEGIELILKMKPKKIGYISCNAATLARDIKMLSDNYTVKCIDIVDLFPWTGHSEVVTVLEIKNA